MATKQQCKQLRIDMSDHIFNSPYFDETWKDFGRVGGFGNRKHIETIARLMVDTPFFQNGLIGSTDSVIRYFENAILETSKANNNDVEIKAIATKLANQVQAVILSATSVNWIVGALFSVALEAHRNAAKDE